jgi:hypothetical protein
MKARLEIHLRQQVHSHSFFCFGAPINFIFTSYLSSLLTTLKKSKKSKQKTEKKAKDPKDQSKSNLLLAVFKPVA